MTAMAPDDTAFAFPVDGVPVLTTERMVLRAPALDDAEAIAAILSDYDVSRMLARVPSPFFRQDATDWLERMNNGVGRNELAFALTLDDLMIGIVGLDHTGGKIDIGYWLDRSHWQRGLMSEAVRVVLSWHFESDPEGIVRSGVFSDNAASLALQKKLGFVETGISEVFSLARGRLCSRIETRIDAVGLMAKTKPSPASDK